MIRRIASDRIGRSSCRRQSSRAERASAEGPRRGPPPSRFDKLSVCVFHVVGEFLFPNNQLIQNDWVRIILHVLLRSPQWRDVMTRVPLAVAFLTLFGLSSPETQGGPKLPDITR